MKLRLAACLSCLPKGTAADRGYMTIGDGGGWSVVFDEEDNVVECERFSRWVC